MSSTSSATTSFTCERSRSRALLPICKGRTRNATRLVRRLAPQGGRGRWRRRRAADLDGGREEDVRGAVDALVAAALLAVRERPRHLVAHVGAQLVDLHARGGAFVKRVAVTCARRAHEARRCVGVGRARVSNLVAELVEQRAVVRHDHHLRLPDRGDDGAERDGRKAHGLARAGLRGRGRAAEPSRQAAAPAHTRRGSDAEERPPAHGPGGDARWSDGDGRTGARLGRRDDVVALQRERQRGSLGRAPRSAAAGRHADPRQPSPAGAAAERLHRATRGPAPTERAGAHGSQRAAGGGRR